LNRVRYWHVVDARDKVVGKLASSIARVLQGKHKPVFNPSVDCGDYVIVLNSKFIQFSGKKWSQKLYRWHTGYTGNLKTLTAQQVLERNPERILEAAVFGMLPKNRLRLSWFKRLRVYPDGRHLHEKQVENEGWPSPYSPLDPSQLDFLTRIRDHRFRPFTNEDVLIEIQDSPESFSLSGRNLTTADIPKFPPGIPIDIRDDVKPKRLRGVWKNLNQD